MNTERMIIIVFLIMGGIMLVLMFSGIPLATNLGPFVNGAFLLGGGMVIIYFLMKGKKDKDPITTGIQAAEYARKMWKEEHPDAGDLILIGGRMTKRYFDTENGGSREFYFGRFESFGKDIIVAIQANPRDLLWETDPDIEMRMNPTLIVTRGTFISGSPVPRPRPEAYDDLRHGSRYSKGQTFNIHPEKEKDITKLKKK